MLMKFNDDIFDKWCDILDQSTDLACRVDCVDIPTSG